MNRNKADVFPFGTEVAEMCAKEINQEQGPDEIPPWDGESQPTHVFSEIPAFRVSPDGNKSLEVEFLRTVDAILHLIERSEEYENN